jgi:alkylation response protein AidB-like acyl-CoA dehydrogenase
MQYCRILEEIGRRDASTSVFVNAHHSIGIRALLLFGTREQQAQWLPSLVAGEKLAAFALTEREAGSDAANVRMTATPSEDGSHYILNGEKRYITNAAVSQVWTVMARTPVPDKPGKDAITAFLRQLLTFDKQSNIRRATRLASRKLRREFCDAACV